MDAITKAITPAPGFITAHIADATCTDPQHRNQRFIGIIIGGKQNLCSILGRNAPGSPR